MRSLGLAVMALVLFVSGVAHAEDTKVLRICIQPLGKYDTHLLGKSVTGIKHVYGFPVKVLAKVPMPKSAYYAPRKRWRADRLLDYLDADIIPDSGCAIVIGFTKHDISCTKGSKKDWGIFGLGSVGGTSAVVSTYRLGRKTKSKQKKAIRTVKVVNHELGHVLGLPHCSKDRCMMMDAEGTIKTVDHETGLLCDLCRGEVERRHGVKLPEMEEIDWKELLSTE